MVVFYLTPRELAVEMSPKMLVGRQDRPHKTYAILPASILGRYAILPAYQHF